MEKRTYQPKHSHRFFFRRIQLMSLELGEVVGEPQISPLRDPDVVAEADFRHGARLRSVPRPLQANLTGAEIERQRERNQHFFAVDCDEIETGCLARRVFRKKYSEARGWG